MHFWKSWNTFRRYQNTISGTKLSTSQCLPVYCVCKFLRMTHTLFTPTNTHTHTHIHGVCTATIRHNVQQLLACIIVRHTSVCAAVFLLSRRTRSAEEAARSKGWAASVAWLHFGRMHRDFRLSRRGAGRFSRRASLTPTYKNGVWREARVNDEKSDMKMRPLARQALLYSVMILVHIL